MRPLSLLLWFSFLSGSMINAQNPFVAESQQKLALREAIFRYMFEHYDYGSDVKVYCIAAEKALPDQFVRRFDQVKPRVVWAFECDNSGSMNGITHNRVANPVY